jgi:ankyrin repeat protein
MSPVADAPMKLRISVSAAIIAVACLLFYWGQQGKKPKHDYHIPNGPAIVAAAAKGDLAEVKRIVATSPDSIFAKNEKGATAAEWAVLNDKPDVAKFLVERGYPTDPTPEIPFGLLFACVSRNSSESTDMLKWLLDRGANPNVGYKRESWIPLHLAVNNGMKDKVRILVAKGADIRMRNKQGETAYHIATDQLRRYSAPEFDFPHGELRDPEARASLIKRTKEMVELLQQLGAKESP